jgi:hypothetical protein
VARFLGSIAWFLANHGQSKPYTPFADPHRPEGGRSPIIAIDELGMGLWPTHRDENRVEPEARGDFRRSSRRLGNWRNPRLSNALSAPRFMEGSVLVNCTPLPIAQKRSGGQDGLGSLASSATEAGQAFGNRPRAVSSARFDPNNEIP